VTKGYVKEFLVDKKYFVMYELISLYIYISRTVITNTQLNTCVHEKFKPDKKPIR
jgi:hypothetical protein